ncbi:MAG TPA: hypothetical protein VLY63_23425 [Anaerolineae bacterium]|nr:hypothetical protein [Anaerolineae bacterium]
MPKFLTRLLRVPGVRSWLSQPRWEIRTTHRQHELPSTGFNG